MEIIFKLNNYFFSSFREFFVYHYSSLHFRARIFALIIGADEYARVDNYILVRRLSLDIYKGDEKRADILKLATKEIVDKIKNKTLSIDSLVFKIQSDLKKTPRYAKKIDIDVLQEFLMFPYDEDTVLYQERIIEFLQNIKEETFLKSKKRSKNSIIDKECH